MDFPKFRIFFLGNLTKRLKNPTDTNFDQNPNIFSFSSHTGFAILKSSNPALDS